MEDDADVEGMLADRVDRQPPHDQRVGLGPFQQPSRPLENLGQFPGSGGPHQRRPLSEFADRAAGDEPAGVDDHQIVGEVFHLGQ